MKTKLCMLLTYLLWISVPLLSQNIGDKAPDFTVTSLTGSQIKLSDYAGKVVFIFFLGNECPYCKAIGNDTETKVQAVFGNRGDFQAIGLDTWDASSTVTTLNAFRIYTGITYPLGLKSGSVSTLYNTTYDRVMVIDKSGTIRHKSNTSTASDLQNAINSITTYLEVVGINDVSDDPSKKLSQNYPNPVHGNSTIAFKIKESGYVNLSVISLSGKVIKTLISNYMPLGEHQININSKDYKPGIYIYRLENDNSVLLKRMIVLE